jgi:glucosamine-6-phosphate deaminase
VSPQVRERVPVVVAEYDEICRRVARRIADIIVEKRKAGSHAVLGLATGSTPIGIYRELARLHREENLDFSDVVTFNLDEYYPMRPDSIHSYNRYMWENLFDEINVKPENVHVPNGNVPRDSWRLNRTITRSNPRVGRNRYSDSRNRKDRAHRLQRAGLGVDSRTRLISLDTVTRA